MTDDSLPGLPVDEIDDEDDWWSLSKSKQVAAARVEVETIDEPDGLAESTVVTRSPANVARSTTPAAKPSDKAVTKPSGRQARKRAHKPVTKPAESATKPARTKQPAKSASAGAGANRSDARPHPRGRLILLLGVFGFLIAPLAPTAWFTGNNARLELRAHPEVQWTNRRMVRTGRLLGIVGTVAWAVAAVTVVIWSLAG